MILGTNLTGSGGGKFPTPLSDWSKPPRISTNRSASANIRNGPIRPASPPAAANCNCGALKPRLYAIQTPGIIRTGSFVGLPKKRPTDRKRALSFDQVRGLANAVAYAAAEDSPLNAFLTIRWTMAAGFTDERWPAIQTDLLNRLTRFLRRRKIMVAFAWTRERQHGVGAHTHVALHLGLQPLKIRPPLLAHLYRRFGFRDDPLSTGLDLRFGTFGMNTAEMRAGAVRYLCKSLDHSAFFHEGNETRNLGDALGVNHRGTQGLITIKRCGVSQTVSRKARSAADWREVRDIVGIARIFNPEPNMRAAA